MHLPSFVQKIIESRISQTSAEMPPKNGGVRKANWLHVSHRMTVLAPEYIELTKPHHL
jgi:hypothetical protein